MTRRGAVRSVYRESWLIYRAHPIALLGPGVVLFVLFAVPAALLSEVHERTTVAHDLVLLAVEAFSFMSAFLYYGYCEKIVGQARSQATVSVWRGLRDSAHVLIPLAAASLVAEALIVVGVLALVVPGIYLLDRLVVAAPAASFEHLWPWRAIQRSWRLTRGHFWLVAATAGVLLAAELLVGSGGEAIGSHLTSDETAGRIVGETGGDLLVGPFAGVLTAALYFRFKDAWEADAAVAKERHESRGRDADQGRRSG